MWRNGTTGEIEVFRKKENQSLRLPGGYSNKLPSKTETTQICPYNFNRIELRQHRFE